MLRVEVERDVHVRTPAACSRTFHFEGRTMPTTLRTTLAAALVVALAGGAVGCADATSNADTEADGDDTEQSSPKADDPFETNQGMSFEEFRERAYCEPDTDVCTVDGDYPITGGEEGLREFYRQRVANNSRSLLVHRREDGVDARWSRAKRLNLTYCVSREFDERRDAILTAVQQAANDWEKHAHVDFTYKPEFDDRCSQRIDDVVFPVEPAPSDSRYHARAFFPNWEKKKQRVRVNLDKFEESKEDDDHGDEKTLAGLFRHELGHVLGFRHEHTRPENDAGYFCFENEQFRPLTEYDGKSVMHYAWCDGEGNWANKLTDYDQRGASFFYPNFEDYPRNRCDRELDDDGNVRAACEPVAHQIVEFANSADREILDEWAGLDTRAVDDIVTRRSETAFHDLEELKSADYLAEHGVRKVYDYLYVDGRCPEEVDEQGRIVPSCEPVANRILELANTASHETLDNEVGLDVRAADRIVEQREERPYVALAELWMVDWVRTRAIGKMYEYLYE